MARKRDQVPGRQADEWGGQGLRCTDAELLTRNLLQGHNYDVAIPDLVTP